MERQVIVPPLSERLKLPSQTNNCTVVDKKENRREMKTEKLKLATCTSIEQIFSQTIDVPGCRCCCRSWTKAERGGGANRQAGRQDMSVDLLHGSESKRGSRMLRGILQKTIKRAALALTVCVCVCVLVCVRSECA